MQCVNALNGLFSFLREQGYYDPDFPKGCVNALNGLFSFLQDIPSAMPLTRGVCQRPERAFFISTAPNTTSTPIRFSVSTP